MVKKRGIPQEVIDQLKLKEPKKKTIITRLLKEGHQVRISIPSRLRRQIDFSKFNTVELIYNESKKEIICRLK